MVLILVCAFVILIVLMQRASSNAGLGSALGGGAMESALGGGASNVLTKGTVLGASLFFLIAFGLYLGHMAAYEGEVRPSGTLPSLEALAPEEAGTSALRGALTGTDSLQDAEPEDAAQEAVPAEGAQPAETAPEAEQAEDAS